MFATARVAVSSATLASSRNRFSYSSRSGTYREKYTRFASSVFPWLFEEEASPTADVILALVIQQGAIVPALWYAEIENGLGLAERRNRLSPEGVRKRLRCCETCPWCWTNRRRTGLSARSWS